MAWTKMELGKFRVCGAPYGGPIGKHSFVGSGLFPPLTLHLEHNTKSHGPRRQQDPGRAKANRPAVHYVLLCRWQAADPALGVFCFLKN